MKKLFCLFSLMAISQFIAQAQRFNGYTLYSLQNATSAVLMDSNQVSIKTWTFPAADRTGYSTYMEPGGTLVRAVSRTGNSFTGGPICGKIQKVDYQGNIIWDFVYSTTDYCTHHDICPLPNGNVLAIAYERRSAAETSAMGGNNAIEMWPDKIVEIQPTGLTTGNVVWEWKAWDHLLQTVDPNKPNYVSNASANPGRLNINYKQTKDWLHLNGIDYNPLLDQIIVSSRYLSEWLVIDHSTTTAEAATSTGGNSGKGGDILFRWGNPESYGVPGTAILNVTHDAHWIPEGYPNAGRMAGFNNKGVSATQSAGDEMFPPINGYNYNYTQGQAYLPNSYAKRHEANGYTSNMGGYQHLPNGNRLVTIALSGKMYEIDSNNTQLWTKTVQGSISKAKMYPICYIDTPVINAPTVSVNGSQLTSSNAASYQWYRNGEAITGATSQNYTATQSGVYLVRVSDPKACYFKYSTGVKITLWPASTTDLSLTNQTTIYPNPTQGIINIKQDLLQTHFYEVIVTDLHGKIIFKGQNTQQINLSQHPNGLYLINIITPQEKYIHKINLVK